MEFKLTYSGFNEIQEVLSQLPAKVNAQIYQAVNKKLLKKHVLDAIKTGTPYSPRTTKNFTAANDRNDKTAVFVGPTGDSYWVRWTELGTKVRKSKKGYNRGAIKGKNTIEPIYDSKVEPIINDVNTEYGNEISKYVGRKVKRYRK